MNLPNYFLADLPPEAALNGGIIADACETLKRNRETYLRDRPTTRMIRTACELATDWLQPDFPFRQMALQASPGETGFSSATLASGLDTFFRSFSTEALEELLTQDLGHPHRLDKFSATPSERQFGRSAFARGPVLLAHITAGNLPIPALWSIILGLLVRSAQFVKCALGASLIPRLFAHSIYQADPKLGACLEVAAWPGGQVELENNLFAQADCVSATGSDEMLASVAQRIPGHVRFLGYGNRVSFGYIARESLAKHDLAQTASRAAADVVAWNQLGCLSPHLFYVERGGAATPEQFADALAQALADCERTEPRGSLGPEAASAIASRRSFYEIRAAHSPDTRQWASGESTAWTVVYEADPRFQLSCLHRFVYVKPVGEHLEALQAADAVVGRVSTMGLAAPEHRASDIATAFARWGATRICPLGRMQAPPLGWRHDGRPALADLVTWTDWEHER